MPFPAKPSQVDIVNMALGLLKCRKISSMSENSVEAVEANRWYEPARREALRGHDWTWATSVTTLALNATYAASASGVYAGKWKYAYTYPANIVAIWHLYNEFTQNKSVGEDFRELYDSTNNQTVIVTDCEDALAEATFDLSDTTLFDSFFVTAFSYVLAAKMAPALTGDDSIADALLKKANIAMSESERMNSYEQNVTEQKTSSYQDAR
jgi:hypothetical protein